MLYLCSTERSQYLLGLIFYSFGANIPYCESLDKSVNQNNPINNYPNPSPTYKGVLSTWCGLGGQG